MSKTTAYRVGTAILAVVTVLFANQTWAGDKTEQKTKPQVRVVAREDSNPEKWQPEISIGKVGSYSDYEKIKNEAYEKMASRKSRAYDQKARADSDIYKKYLPEQRTALENLKKEDLAAAIFWLEINSTLYYSYGIDGERKPPTSEAYNQFTKTMKDIDRRESTEMEKVENDYTTSVDKADKMYEAERDKADELYTDYKEASPGTP